jgi:plasmid replication initiation protein
MTHMLASPSVGERGQLELFRSVPGALAPHDAQNLTTWPFFDVSHLHLKSGAHSPLRRFAFELRAIVRRQPLPGYVLAIEHSVGRKRLNFVLIAVHSIDAAVRRLELKPVDKPSC